MQCGRLFFLSILLAFCLQGHAQDQDDVTIRWNPDKKLSWSDYSADPEKDSKAAASTATYLGLEYHRDENGFTFKVHCSFSTKRSWGLYKTDYILAHEQGHFDISEVSARLLYKKLKEYRFNEKTYRADLNRIYENALKEKERLQQLYDKETNHSINKPLQQEWFERIRVMLKETAAYAGY